MRISKANFIRTALLVFGTLVAASLSWARNADTILVNGKILTVDSQFSTRAAIAIRDGSLEPGKLADLAVLSKDYMTVPADQIGGIESLLTMVGGKIVYTSGPYARVDQDSQQSTY